MPRFGNLIHANDIIVYCYAFNPQLIHSTRINGYLISYLFLHTRVCTKQSKVQYGTTGTNTGTTANTSLLRTVVPVFVPGPRLKSDDCEEEVMATLLRAELQLSIYLSKMHDLRLNHFYNIAAQCEFWSLWIKIEQNVEQKLAI